MRSGKQSLAAVDIRAVRSRLVDRVLVYFALLLPLGVVLSIARSSVVGWQPIYILHVAITLVIITVAALRRRLSYRVRAATLLGIVMLIGVAGLFTRVCDETSEMPREGA